MGPFLAAGIGLLCGVLIAVVWTRRSTRRPPEIRPVAPVGSRVSDAVVAEMSIAAAAVDANDSVLLVNDAAYRVGIIRDGSLVKELRPLVRQARRDGLRRQSRVTVQQATALGRRPLPLAVTVLSLGGNDVAILAEDVTEVERVEAVRRDFVANVGHEIKTPVGAISLLAEAALDAHDDREAVERFLGRLQHEAGRLSRLVQELIDLSRLQGGEPLPEPTRVSVDAVVEEALDRIRAAAEVKSIALESGGDDGLTVLGNHRQLVTALGNLLENAVAYSAAGTRVAVGVHRRPDAVEIAVADEGIGIDRGDLTRILERFYRADPARSRATGGTGLGLAIVKHIVGNHGGEVTVSSSVGVGSTFTVRLPAASIAPTEAPRAFQEVNT